jgi:hypothetical protein
MLDLVLLLVLREHLVGLTSLLLRRLLLLLLMAVWCHLLALP